MNDSGNNGANGEKSTSPNSSLLQNLSHNGPTTSTLSSLVTSASDATTPKENLGYTIKTKPKDEERNIVRLPKTDKSGEVKVDKKGNAKCRVRVEKFDKEGNQKLKFDGNFNYGFTRLRKVGNTALALVLVLILGSAGTLFYIYNSLNSTIDEHGAVIGPLSDAVTKGDPIEIDEYGRANIVIFGTSEDDDGHGGAELTDSIMVLSIDPTTGAANAVSIPRDLTYYDKKQTNSKTGLCSAGRAWKINTAYMCGLEFSESHDEVQKQIDGTKYAADIIADVTGLTIQYYAKVNYALVVDIVDAVGGIDVTPYTDDPRGIYDCNTYMPGVKDHCLKLEPGYQHLNGWTALQLSRARNDAVGYGLSRSNFDRELNQQIVLNGIREKAATSGILLNPLSMLQIIQAMGNNIVSNLPTAQFKSFGKAGANMVNLVSVPLIGTADSIEIELNKDVGQEVKENKAEKNSQNAQYIEKGMVSSGASSTVSGSVVKPNLGEFNWGGIRTYIRAVFDGKTPDEVAAVLKDLKATNTNNATDSQ